MEYPEIDDRLKNIEAALVDLDSRMKVIEKHFEIYNEIDSTNSIDTESGEEIEFRLGEKWFGKLGIIMFLLATSNFLIFPIEAIPFTVVILIGIIISALMIVSAHLLTNKIENLSNYILGSGLIILFLTVLRLKYFGESSVIENELFISPMLLFISIGSLYFSLKRKSLPIYILGSIFLIAAGFITNSYFIMLLSAALVFILSIYIWSRTGWISILQYSIPALFISIFLVAVNNPLFNEKLFFNQEYYLTLVLIPIYSLFYGIVFLYKEKGKPEDSASINITQLNGIISFLTFTIICLGIGIKNFGLLYLLLFASMFTLAIIYWINQRSKISTFIYSMLAYASLSVAILSYFATPFNLVLLSWQSLLVVSTALWFRNKIIVVTNFFIFLAILIAYLFMIEKISWITSGFGIIALISARVINWQKERLELKTENLRNFYLLIAFLIFPWIIYSNLSSHYVGIALIILAFIYYTIGKLIDNKKYRIMASGTLILSLIYIMIFALTTDESDYRAISFLLVSFSLIITSIVYAKERFKGKEIN
mgnify:CR=1 FL=1